MKQTLLYSALLASALVCADVRNGSFDRKGGKPPTQATVEAYRKAGIECPDAKDWTPYWGTLGKSGKIEFLSGGVRGRFVRLSKGAYPRLSWVKVGSGYFSGALSPWKRGVFHLLCKLYPEW